MALSSEKHTAFRANQARIYDNFSNAHSILGTSAVLSGSVTRQGAYLVALRHPEEIAEQAAAISLEVAEHFPAVTYGRANLHTTVSDYGLSPDLTIDPSNNKTHRAILDSLCKIVSTGLSTLDFRTIQSRNIQFGRVLSNANSVIAPGYGNESTLDIRQAILDASRNSSEGLPGAWGLHMTLNRFIGTSTLQQAQLVTDVLNSKPAIGNSVPTRIDVGFLQVSEHGFSFVPDAQFEFSKFSGR